MVSKIDGFEPTESRGYFSNLPIFLVEKAVEVVKYHAFKRYE
jgi:hypothetical protein